MMRRLIDEFEAYFREPEESFRMLWAIESHHSIRPIFSFGGK